MDFGAAPSVESSGVFRERSFEPETRLPFAKHQDRRGSFWEIWDMKHVSFPFASPTPRVFPRRPILLLPLAAVLLTATGQVLGDLSFAFVSRDIRPTTPQQGPRTNAIERTNNGKLWVKMDGEAPRVIVDSTSGGFGIQDVLDPEVSYDGGRILFAGYLPADRGFRIFEVGIDGTGLRQVTHSDRQVDLGRYGDAGRLLETYDDLDPVYLPEGRIVFVSTRYPGIAPDNRLRTTNLYVANADGSQVHRITSERFAADTPTVNPRTGQITYSRWWRTPELNQRSEPIPPGNPGYEQVGNTTNPLSNQVLTAIQGSEFPGVNSWFLSSVNPDGTGLSMASGFRLDRELTQAHRPSFLEDGSVLALFIPQTPMLGSPMQNGLRRYQLGPSIPEFIGGPQQFPNRNPMREPGVDGLPVPPPVASEFFYSSAVALPGSRALVTGAQMHNPADYGVYSQSLSDRIPTPVLDFPGTQELDAVPILVRPLPPQIPDQATASLLEDTPLDVNEATARGTFTFRCLNIHFNAPVDTPIANAPPIGRNLSIQFFMAPQRTSTETKDAPFLVAEQTIPSDGKIEQQLPGGVPLFEVLHRRDDTIPVGRDGQIFHVGGMNFNREGQGDKGGCVGCHAGHSMIAVPEDPSWTNLAPSATASASFPELLGGQVVDGRFGFFVPQAVLDRRTDPLISEWAGSPEKPESWVQLDWTVPLVAREVVVYGIRPNPQNQAPRTLRINAFTVTTYKWGTYLDDKGDQNPENDEWVEGPILQDTVQVAGPLSSTGTRVAMNSAIEFDSLRVTIALSNVSGHFDGMTRPAISEVEVISKRSGNQEVNATFVRSDVDCSGQVNVTDAISSLNTLFRGGSAFCCGAAADVNDDSTINITDAVLLLSYLFMGANEPAMPFPECGKSGVGPFVCDLETCPQ
jgi:hypothetical protein